MYIYKIINLITSEIYVGQTTKSIETRFAGHCSKSSRSLISLAIQKYGKENFTIELIDIASDQKDLDSKEVYWIETLDTISPKGYNKLQGRKIPFGSTLLGRIMGLPPDAPNPKDNLDIRTMNWDDIEKLLDNEFNDLDILIS